ncbi:MAG TPA: flavodoxin-dependent (E)-4-hydroxy-3-methylbut-2-enyl-diphosphate synthase [Turneriella sp.]|nr:flavodoxin-dependent (E)-4-hydroxy-3-methylbut-2-enyl-diphosphate synthase [Turneriella sp.]HNJ64786.1 flavodoxin-dependent (E)-4-hydroxy-3-methylbut-2-enyl-diphosphate synthase [Turneriella sp.]HNL09914.1 flavodoxin-dependent (E)-4-hydroxy-3-methylbut-2-enyl-diphosphate synthase [Turneriella sp.]HNL53175.1 flavodoxin-dependent (E)-4-hydroxy-3-methylbut-2-enyl-diphosphate synthase [Turneriella sp.]HNM99014.1 flavodoxin-dependent (E)-4-hydroxy-3-methylbut-2-enyl-diphosphate synthase [Turnerie
MSKQDLPETTPAEMGDKTVHDTIQRRKTRTVKVGNMLIGSGHPIAVQSMTKTKTADWKATVEQILRYEEAGCQVVRCTANDEDAANALKKIKENIHIPLVADIHFQHKLALIAIKSGVDKIRINPGNIGNKDKVSEVLRACKDNGIPIRIGVNAGSLEKDILRKHGYPTSDGMVESALRHIEICNEHNFEDVIVSLKSSDVFMMMEAYRKLAKITDYPLHLGVTEAGTSWQGTIKSSIGIGGLLAEGIGDTIRVSLTTDGTEEIKVGREILRSLGLTSFGVTLVSCPTCGRLEVDLFRIAKEVEEAVAHIKTPLKVAVMGCLVNGPGESKEADIGISAGAGSAILYVKGESKGKIAEAEIVPRLLEEIKLLEDAMKKA